MRREFERVAGSDNPDVNLKIFILSAGRGSLACANRV